MAFFPNFSQFPEYVRMELNRRTRNQSEVSKLTAWVRVSSAVSEIRNGVTQKGMSIISNPDYTLFSSVSGESSVYGSRDSAGTIGTDWSGKPINPKSDIGFHPKPNIASLEIDEGMGALSRRASFTITAYTVNQLDELCKYFLEPGFSVFLEWGWNTSDAVSQLVHLDEAVKEGGIGIVSKFQSFDNVNDSRYNSKGCYDNYLGFITGGGITMEGDHWIISVSCTGFTELPAYLMVTDNAQSTNVTDKDGNVTVDDINTAKNFTAHDLEYTTLDDTGRGKKMFMLMFNDLPSTRKTNEVRNLINDPKVCRNGFFINFDTEIRAKCNRDAKVEETTTSEVVKIRDGMKLVGDERFINFGALMEIINANGIDEFKIGKTVVATKIDVSSTIISAFKRIFSHDKKKLFIPNKFTPRFSIDYAANNTTRQVDFINIDPVDNHVLNDSSGNPITFPSVVNVYSESDTYIQHTMFQYGYLRDLYVNFDFVTGILDTKNFTMKDALYQILNGISSAAGGMWDFQIQEKPATIKNSNGTEVKTTILSVIDLNYVSSGPELPHEFYAIGDQSIFMEANLDMDISGEKMNQIIGNRLAASTGKVLNSSQPTMKGNLFSTTATDMILDAIKYTNVAPPQEKVLDKSDWKKEVEANLKAYLDDVGMYPKVGLTPSVELSPIMTNYLYVACFNSQTIFDALKNNNDLVNIANVGGVSPLLPINFTFTIHGISGIQRGSKFVVYGLPNKYSTDGFFQVTSVKHIIDGMLWKTEVTGGFRIQRAGKSGTIKENTTMSTTAEPYKKPVKIERTVTTNGPVLSTANTADKLFGNGR